MERIVPVPALTPLVVIAQYPLKSLNVALSNSLLELSLFFISVDEEFVWVVSLFVALLSELNFVDILGNQSIVLRIANPFDLCLYTFCDFFSFRILTLTFKLRFLINLGLLKQFGLCFGLLLICTITSVSIHTSSLIVLASPAPSASTTIICSRFFKSFKTFLLLSEKFLLVLSNITEEHITVAEIDDPLLGQVAIQTWQGVFVHGQNRVQCALSDLQRGQMR